MKDLTTMTVGCDLGDRKSALCFLDADGDVVRRDDCATTRQGFRRMFQDIPPARVVIEVGTHSRWVSELLRELGHEVVVANPRRVKLISHNQAKCDITDAELLARLGRADATLLSPVAHRGEQAQTDLAVIKSRACLVEARNRLINHARGMVKSFGERLPRCSTAAFAKKTCSSVPENLRPALEPIFEAIRAVDEQLKRLDHMIEDTLAPRHTDVEVLTTIDGVGVLTALTFILTLEDPQRFTKSRKVGAFLGLRARTSQSGERDPELSITKAGDTYLRSLLVNCAHYILGPFGPGSDLRDWGLRLAARGKKNAKKRAVVAVARRLAVTLHRMWVTGEAYQPRGHVPVRQAA